MCVQKSETLLPHQYAAAAEMAKEENPHYASYRGYRHETKAAIFSNLITPGVSFVKALQGSPEQRQQLQARQVTAGGPPAT
jgi:hypothetical protein